MQTKHKTPMVRTQSIISVSDEVVGGSQLQKSGSASNIGGQENNVSREGSGGVRKNRLRNRRGITKQLKNISGSSQEDTGGKDTLDRVGLTREEEKMRTVKSCSPRRNNTSASSLR